MSVQFLNHQEIMDPVRCVFLIDTNNSRFDQLPKVILRILSNLSINTNNEHSIFWQYRILDSKQPPSILRYRIKSMMSVSNISHDIKALFNELDQHITRKKECEIQKLDICWSHIMCHLTQSLTDFPWTMHHNRINKDFVNTRFKSRFWDKIDIDNDSLFDNITQYLFFITFVPFPDSIQSFNMKRYHSIIDEYTKRCIVPVWILQSIPTQYMYDLYPYQIYLKWACDICYNTLNLNILTYPNNNRLESSSFIYTNENEHYKDQKGDILNTFFKLERINPIGWIKKNVILEHCLNIIMFCDFKILETQDQDWYQDWRSMHGNIHDICLYAWDPISQRYMLMICDTFPCIPLLICCLSLTIPLKENVKHQIFRDIAKIPRLEITKDYYLEQSRSRSIFKPDNIDQKGISYFDTLLATKIESLNDFSRAQTSEDTIKTNNPVDQDKIYSIIYESTLHPILTSLHVESIKSSSSSLLDFVSIPWESRCKILSKLWLSSKCNTFDSSDRELYWISKLLSAYPEPDILSLKDIFQARELQIRLFTYIIHHKMFVNDVLEELISSLVGSLNLYFALHAEFESEFSSLLLSYSKSIPVCITRHLDSFYSDTFLSYPTSHERTTGSKRSLFRSNSESIHCITEMCDINQSKHPYMKTFRELEIKKSNNTCIAADNIIENKTLSDQIPKKTSWVVLETPKSSRIKNTKLMNSTVQTLDHDEDEEIVIVETPKKKNQ